MELHTLGIDLGKTVFHAVGPQRARRSIVAQEVFTAPVTAFHS